jgi:TolB-like protein/Tfp pilus assembly protein PilF
MEYVEGRTLEETIGRKGLPLAEVLQYGIQIAGALAAAHAAGIIHRDLKPSNIMTTKDGVKVLDFGLAKFASSSPGVSRSTQALTAEHAIVGTLAYMAPEQLAGAECGFRTDVFALGLILYEMIAGRPVFGGASRETLMEEVLRCLPAPLENVPVPLAHTIERCLAREPEQRTQSARDVQAELEWVRGNLANPKHFGLEAPSKRRGRWLITGTAAAMLLLVAAAALYFFAGRGKAIQSIAILPFVDATGSADVTYFSDGITETVINSLSQLSGLKVISRSTAFRYKGHEADPQIVGRDLKVRAVLVGRVLQRGGEISVSTELVDASDGRRLWGEQYHGKLTDLLAIEEHLGREIAEHLRVRLSPDEAKRLTKQYTQNSEAHREYLQGLYFWNKRTGPSIQTAIEHFQRAIAKDPAYGLAYAGLAKCYTAISNFTEIPPAESYPKARAAALEALRIDDSLAEAHAVLGASKHRYEWDWAGGERHYKRALELNPGDADAHSWYSQYLLAIGRPAEALAEAKRAQDLDPLSLNNNASFAAILYHLRRFDHAVEELRKTLVLEPSFGFAHSMLGWVYGEKSMYAEAIAEFQSALRIDKGNWQAIGGLGRAYAKSGKRTEARKMADDLAERCKLGHVPALAVAMVYIGLDDKDRAFDWLGKALEQRGLLMTFLRIDPLYDPLRSDPRFNDLLRVMKLVQ